MATNMFATSVTNITSRYLQLRLTASTNSSNMTSVMNVRSRITCNSLSIYSAASKFSSAAKPPGNDCESSSIFACTSDESFTIFTFFDPLTERFMMSSPLMRE